MSRYLHSGPSPGEALAGGVQSFLQTYNTQKDQQRRQQEHDWRREQMEHRRGLMPLETERAQLGIQNTRQTMEHQQAIRPHELTRAGNQAELSGLQVQGARGDIQHREAIRPHELEDIGNRAALSGLQVEGARDNLEHSRAINPHQVSQAETTAETSRLQLGQLQQQAEREGLLAASQWLLQNPEASQQQLDDIVRWFDSVGNERNVRSIRRDPQQPGRYIVGDDDGEFGFDPEQILGMFAQQQQPDTERTRKIQALVARGMSPPDAADLVEGRVQMTQPDQFGDVYLVNTTDGSRRRVTDWRGQGEHQPEPSGYGPGAPGGDQQRVAIPEGPVQSPQATGNRGAGVDLDAAAAEGTGPFAAMRQLANNVIGPALVGQPFPNTEAARNTLRLFGQEAKTALVNNPRFPVAEQQIVQGMLPDPGRFFTDPDGEREKIRQLHQHLSEKLAQNERTLHSSQITMKNRGELLDQNAAIERVLGMMGPTSERAEPRGRGRTMPGAPEPGTVEDGWLYQGGDPADPSSWVRR